MSELVAWLRVQVDADDAWVSGDGGRYLDDCQECGFGQQPDSPYSRARMLREVEAKRRRLERHRPETRTIAGPCGEPTFELTVCVQCSAPGPLSEVDEVVQWPCPDIRDDAAVFADRPGYREEWRP